MEMQWRRISSQSSMQGAFTGINLSYLMKPIVQLKTTSISTLTSASNLKAWRRLKHNIPAGTFVQTIYFGTVQIPHYG